MALVMAIILLATNRTGTIYGPAWTGVGLHTLHSHTVRKAQGVVRSIGPEVAVGPMFQEAP